MIECIKVSAKALPGQQVAGQAMQQQVKAHRVQAMDPAVWRPLQQGVQPSEPLTWAGSDGPASELPACARTHTGCTCELRHSSRAFLNSTAGPMYNEHHPVLTPFLKSTTKPNPTPALPASTARGCRSHAQAPSGPCNPHPCGLCSCLCLGCLRCCCPGRGWLCAWLRLAAHGPQALRGHVAALSGRGHWVRHLEERFRFGTG